jgi:hypothetical protein
VVGIRGTRRKLAAVEMPRNQDDDHSIAQESPHVRDHNDYEEQSPVHESHSLTTLIRLTSASAFVGGSRLLITLEQPRISCAGRLSVSIV